MISKSLKLFQKLRLRDEKFDFNTGELVISQSVAVHKMRGLDIAILQSVLNRYLSVKALI